MTNAVGLIDRLSGCSSDNSTVKIKMVLNKLSLGFGACRPGADRSILEEFNGSIDRSILEEFNGSIDKSILEEFNGSIDKSILEEFNGSIDKSILEEPHLTSTSPVVHSYISKD